MLKLNKKIIILITLIVIGILLFTNNVFALSNPDEWKPTLPNNNEDFLAKAGTVIGWIRYIGTLVAVVALTIMGLKYSFGSIEAKAEYKKTMFPYILGCFMLVGITVIIGLIQSIAEI